jgi:hypothetical protein
MLIRSLLTRCTSSGSVGRLGVPFPVRHHVVRGGVQLWVQFRINNEGISHIICSQQSGLSQLSQPNPTSATTEADLSTFLLRDVFSPSSRTCPIFRATSSVSTKPRENSGSSRIGLEWETQTKENYWLRRTRAASCFKLSKQFLKTSFCTF